MTTAAQPAAPLTARRRPRGAALACAGAAALVVPTLAFLAAPSSTAAVPGPLSTTYPPAQVPTGLVSRNQGNDVVLNWDPPSSPRTTTYEVLENGKVVARNDTTSVRLTGLPLGSQHTYRVRALNELRLPTAASAPVTETVPPPRGVMPCLDVPVTGLKATDVTPTSLTLSWTDPLLTDPAYDTFPSGRRYTVLQGSTQVTQSWTGRAIHVSGLSPATATTFTVRVPGCRSASVDSQPLAVTTPEGVVPLPAPLDLTVTQPYPEALELAWTPPEDTSGIDHFAVYFDSRLVRTIPVGKPAEVVLSVLTWGETFDVAVTAVGPAGNESAAARVTAMVSSCRERWVPVPRKVSVKVASRSSVVVTWVQYSQPESTAILVDGEVAAVVDSLGSALLTGLTPGSHRIAVDPQLPVRGDLCADVPASYWVQVKLDTRKRTPGRPGTPEVALTDGPTFLTSTVKLTWAASPSTASGTTTPAKTAKYRIYDDAGKLLATSRTTSTMLTLAAGTTTRLRVVAVAGGGLESLPSETVTVHVPGPLVP